MTNKQILFLQKLEGLVELGQQKGRSLSADDIDSYFQGDTTAKEQYGLICEYLFSKQIKVEGYHPEKTEPAATRRPLGETEKAFISQYEEDLTGIPEYSREELDQMGIENPKLLKEAMLRPVYELTKEYFYGNSLVQDVVQEANLALLLATEKLEGKKNPYDYIMEEVSVAIEALLAEEGTTDLEGKKLAEKLNALVDASEKLKAENQGQITMEELSEFMELTPEEIEDLLRVAGELSDKE